jgi:formate hydrogenlyase subunit 3/multisubunit Na+/H+ antiporter MnhD subunit
MTDALVQSSDGGHLLVLALLLPVSGVLLSFLLGRRLGPTIALIALSLGAVITALIGVELVQTGVPLVYVIGGWAPPLGVVLRADGLSLAMMATAIVVLLAIALYARTEFTPPAGQAEARLPFVFWTLLLGVWAGLVVVVLASDLFTLYVALELLTFAAVPMVSLEGRADTLRAALRYLLYALAGSVLYLLGCVLLYGAYGTLDIGLLAQRAQPEVAAFAACALMTAGLLAKTALFPLHMWLPPAHAGAPAAASALLSALVVKGSLFIVLRLWLEALPGVVSPAAAQVPAALGAIAIFYGSALALRQQRLKPMVAYSTVAQLGYLFLMLPLALGATALGQSNATALAGGMMQLASHATAKASMFMTAGLVYTALGHDRVADLTGLARRLPLLVWAFALAGIALIGLPPSGGFLAKWLLLSASLATGQWWWMLALAGGGLLTAAYVVKVLALALTSSGPAPTLKMTVPLSRQWVVLGLAMLSMLLGLFAALPLDIVPLGTAGNR